MYYKDGIGKSMHDRYNDEYGIQEMIEPRIDSLLGGETKELVLTPFCPHYYGIEVGSRR
jgi:hypothetical protein